MSEQDEIRRRLDRHDQQIHLADRTAAYALHLAAHADRDVAEVLDVQRGHTGVLNSLRQTQLEQGAEIRELRSELRMEVRLIRGDTQEGFAQVRSEMTEGFAQVRSEMGDKFTEVNGRIGSLEADVATLKTDVSTLKDGVTELLRRTA